MTLEARNLLKNYGGRNVVDDVSFGVGSGEIVAILGPNGAGKTTSFDMCVGLVKADAGQILFFGKDITKLKIHERARLGIGYLTQEPSAFRAMTVRDNIALVFEESGYPAELRKQKSKELLEEFGIFRLKDEVAASLSGGERRRLEIARVLATDPKFILLDEPFTGIDPIAIGEIQQIIAHLCKKRNIGLLITDHNPQATLDITDRAYIMQDGKIIISGDAQTIASDPMAQKFYLGKDFALSNKSI